MVVKMKRLELLIYHRERERFLDNLKKIGVVHIVEEERTAEEHEIQSQLSSLRRAERVLSLLNKLKKTRTQASALHKTAYTAQALIDRYEELEEQIDRQNQEIAALQKDIKALEPWGDFDPDRIRKLQKIGIGIRFFVASEKAFDSIDRKNVTVEEIRRIERQVYFIVVQRGDAVNVEGEEVRLPEASLGSLRNAVAKAQEALESLRLELESLSWNVDVLVNHVNEMKEKLAYDRARMSMSEQAGGSVLYMKGWLPAANEKAVERLLQSFTGWYKISDPQQGEEIPVKVENGPFSRLFTPILKVYSLPDYFELDPTPFFAPFFTIFVGLCLGDLAYGLILVLLGVVALVKIKASMRPLAVLVVVLGISTSCAGILLNSAFGHTIFGGPGIPEGSAFFPSGREIFAPLGSFTTEKGQTFPMMSFALVIGMLQIFTGMILRSANQLLIGNVAGAVQPVASLLMVLSGLMLAANAHFLNMHTLTVGPLSVGKLLTALPDSVLKLMLAAALLLFLLFNNLQLKIFLRPLMGLWELYQFVSGVVGNLLSYLRLFALGLSGGLLGAAFNYIAFMFITKDGVVNYASPLLAATIIVLILGHSLNIALSCIGSFVHPLRLTFVEFYGNLGFKGGGKPYSPFRQLKPVQESQ